jgi:hypothetical protein
MLAPAGDIALRLTHVRCRRASALACGRCVVRELWVRRMSHRQRPYAALRIMCRASTLVTAAEPLGLVRFVIGAVRRSEARASECAWHGTARQGTARHGKTRCPVSVCVSVSHDYAVRSDRRDRCWRVGAAVPQVSTASTAS